MKRGRRFKKGRRTFRRKRRFSRRRRQAPKLTRKKIEKALQPHKQYRYETMFALSSTLTTFKYTIPYQCVMMSLPYMVHFMKYTDEQGDAIGGDYTYTINSGKKNVTRFLRPTMKVHLRNVSNHGCYVDIYECVFRETVNWQQDSSFVIDWPVSTHGNLFDRHNEPAERAMVQLVQGWFETNYPNSVDLSAGAALDGVEVVAYDANAATANVVNYCETKVKSLLPYSSKQFVGDYRIVSKKTIHMQPGDDFYNTYMTQGMDYQPDIMWDDTSSPDNIIIAVGNVTKFLMFRQHGDIGKDTTNDAIVGYMSSDIAVSVVHTGNVYVHDYLTDVTSTKFSFSTASVLEGPTAFEMFNGDL